MRSLRTYSVEISDVAEADIVEAAEYIARDSSGRARRWYQELKRSIQSLSILPGRFPKIHQDEQGEIRFFMHYSHLVIYRVSTHGRGVSILRVRHSARRPLDPEKLDPSP